MIFPAGYLFSDGIIGNIDYYWYCIINIVVLLLTMILFGRMFIRPQTIPAMILTIYW